MQLFISPDQLEYSQTLQAFLQNYFKELIMNSALSFDLSISALVLILDISSLMIRQNQVVMQVVN